MGYFQHSLTILLFSLLVHSTGRGGDDHREDGVGEEGKGDDGRRYGDTGR